MPKGVVMLLARSDRFRYCVVGIVARVGVDYMNGTLAVVCHISARPIGRYCHSNRGWGAVTDPRNGDRGGHCVG